MTFEDCGLLSRAMTFEDGGHHLERWWAKVVAPTLKGGGQRWWPPPVKVAGTTFAFQL